MTVLLCKDVDPDALARLLARFDLELEWVAPGQPIPGSHFGDPEAGLIGSRLLVREDTPVHSAFHETCHYICMDAARRTHLHTDAGGDYDEENAVCYLQILLADELPGLGRQRMFADMDAWGYSFRLGSSFRWFHEDAEEAHAFLQKHRIVDSQDKPTGLLRQ